MSQFVFLEERKIIQIISRRTNQILDDITINQSISYNLETIPYENNISSSFIISDDATNNQSIGKINHNLATIPYFCFFSHEVFVDVNLYPQTLVLFTFRRRVEPISLSIWPAYSNSYSNSWQHILVWAFPYTKAIHKNRKTYVSLIYLVYFCCWSVSYTHLRAHET